MLNIHFQDSAWKTALQSAAVEYMPRAEVQSYSDIYARLADVSDESEVELQAVIRAKSFMLQMTDERQAVAWAAGDAEAFAADAMMSELI